MEKVKLGHRILESIILAIFTSLFSVGITYLITDVLSKSSCNINVGTSVIDNNKYITPVVISNKSINKAIRKMEISISNYNSIENITINLSCNIDKKNNLVVIDYIPPNETISLLLVTKNIVNIKELKISYDGKLNTIDLSSKTEVFKRIIFQLIIGSLMFSVLFLIIFDLKSKETEIVSNFKKESKEVLEKMDRYKNELNNLETRAHKSRIYNSARIYDYSKELNFWRNTIRKILYNNGSNDGEKIIDMVTKELKTYGTLSDSETEFQDLYYMARNIIDTEKEIK